MREIVHAMCGSSISTWLTHIEEKLDKGVRDGIAALGSDDRVDTRFYHLSSCCGGLQKKMTSYWLRIRVAAPVIRSEIEHRMCPILS